MTAGPRRVTASDAVLLVAVLTVLAGLVAAALLARPGSLDDRARGLEAQLRCPTCQGLSIADSPAQSAVQMRAIVREQLAAGAADDDVREFFVARYGRWILLDPPAAGADLALWLAPAVIVAAGAALVVRRARSHEAVSPSRRWSVRAPLPTSRLATVMVTGAMALALVVPIAAAVGPRLGGREISGGTGTGSAPSIEDLEAFVRAAPDDVEALVTLGDALLTANRPGEAAARYRAALELDPDNVRGLLGVGTILLSADEPDAARTVFERVLLLAPDQPDALLFRAAAARRLAGGPSPDVRRDVERFLAVAAADDPRREMAAALLADDGLPSPPARSSAAPSPSTSPRP